MKDNAKSAVLVPKNPAAETVETLRFDGFRVKRYGKVTDTNPLIVEQMQLVDNKGEMHHVTITEAQKPYLPTVSVQTETGITTRVLQAGDTVRVVCRHTIANETDHINKEGTELVPDKNTGVFPTAMFDGLASPMQAVLFNAELNRYLDGKANVETEIRRAGASALILKAKLAAIKTLSAEEIEEARQQKELVELLG